jgi:hypothetical protein
METVFLVCAIVGGVLLLCQFFLSLVGAGGDHDFGVDHHLDFSAAHHVGGDHAAEHGATWYFHVLSFRAICAAVTFFGLGGLAVAASPSFSAMAFPAGIGSGAAAMIVVAWMMNLLGKLQSKGNVHIERAVGALGTVYLGIPASGQGAGKVTVNVQQRTMEYRAITQHEQPLETGTPVMVVGIAGPDTLEVGPVPE